MRVLFGKDHAISDTPLNPDDQSALKPDALTAGSQNARKARFLCWASAGVLASGMKFSAVILSRTCLSPSAVATAALHFCTTAVGVLRGRHSEKIDDHVVPERFPDLICQYPGNRGTTGGNADE